MVSCIPSWFWGPVVTLEDCLAAFFAADELKGELALVGSDSQKQEKLQRVSHAFGGRIKSGRHAAVFHLGSDTTNT